MAIIIISVISSAFPFGAGLYSLKKKRGDKALAIFTIYAGLAFIVDVTGLLLAMNHIRNHFISHFYVPLEFLLLVWFFTCWMKKDFRKTLFVVMGLGWTIICYDSFIRTKFADFTTLAMVVESGLLVAFAIKNWIGDKDEKKYFGRIILAIGIFTYFGVNIFVFPYLNNYITSGIIHPIFNIVSNIIYGMGAYWYEHR